MILLIPFWKMIQGESELLILSFILYNEITLDIVIKETKNMDERKETYGNAG